MKRRHIVFTLLISFSALASAQSTLSTTGFDALVNPDGTLFNDPSNFVPGFEIPKNSGKHTIYSAGIWFSSLNADSSINLATNLGGNSDFEFGPVATNYNASYDSTYNRTWVIRKTQIDSHKTMYGNTGYVTPEPILNWPAHGNAGRGEAASLAAFHDADSDLLYDPSKGDYPIILGDVAVFFMCNTDRKPSGLPGAKKMELEVLGMVYGFNCPDSAIHNTAFVRYQIINRSSKTFYASNFSVSCDFDLGNPMDDYIECDVDRGLFFALNGDSLDENGSGLLGYQNATPAMGVTILQGPYQDNDNTDNPVGGGAGSSPNGSGYGDVVVDNERLGLTSFVSNGGPTPVPSGFYYLMSGLQISGLPILHFPTSTPTRFEYPASTDSYMYGTGGVSAPYWTESSQGNIGGDRRVLGSMGQFDIAPGEFNQIDLAYIFARSTVNPGASGSKNELKVRTDSIRSYFKNNSAPCGTITGIHGTEEKGQLDVSMYPNPAKETLQIDMHNLTGGRVNIYDLQGKSVQENQLGSGTNQIDVSSLSSGVYVTSIKVAQEVYRTKLVISN